MTHHCPLYIHKGRRPELKIEYDALGPALIVCPESGGVLGCGFVIRRATVTREMWEEWLEFLMPLEVAVAYYDSGARKELA